MHGLRLLMSAAASVLLSSAALAQDSAAGFPSKPVTLIQPTAAGGPNDLELRLYMPHMSALMGQPFITDYKVGAGSTIATAYVAKAAPDGHTMLMVTSGFTVLPALYKDLSFDIIKDFAPVALMSQKPLVLMANTSFPAKTLAEYIAYAKANPKKINYGMTGVGSTAHLAGAWLHSLTGTQVTYVNYKGIPPMVTDMMAGRVDVTVPILLVATPLVKSGKMRVLAVLGDKRSPVFPDVPTVAEQGVPGYNYNTWLGFSAPGGTPAAIVNKLSDAFAKAARAPDVLAAHETNGNVPMGSNAAQFRQVIASEAARWGKVVQDAGIKIDE